MISDRPICMSMILSFEDSVAQVLVVPVLHSCIARTFACRRVLLEHCSYEAGRMVGWIGVFLDCFCTAGLLGLFFGPRVFVGILFNACSKKQIRSL